MIPIAGPVGKSWVELSDVLKRSWQQATSLSNWAVTELRLRDVTRTPGLKRLPRMPSVYLYREAQAFCPGYTRNIPDTSVKRFKIGKLASDFELTLGTGVSRSE